MTKTYNEYIMVTDWEEVNKDDFYLIKEWYEKGGKENVISAKKLQKEGKLYVAYIVPAVHYAIYTQMDAQQVFIDDEGKFALDCESATISNNHSKRWEYSY